MKIQFVAIFIACLSFFIPFCSSAQTQKGGILLAGSGHAQFNDPLEIELQPQAGYFLLNRMAVGASIPVYFLAAGSQRRRTSSLGLDPFVRYYFLQSKLRPFLLVNAGYRVAISSYDDYYNPFERIKNRYNYWNIGAGLGAVYFFSPTVALETSLQYGVTTTTFPYDNRESLGRLTARFSFGIYLSRQK
jgi:hypothetical protein